MLIDISMSKNSLDFAYLHVFAYDNPDRFLRITVYVWIPKETKAISNPPPQKNKYYFQVIIRNPSLAKVSNHYKLFVEPRKQVNTQNKLSRKVSVAW